MAETCPAESDKRKQEETTDSADAAKAIALSDLFPGRQSRGIPSAVAPVIQTKNEERRMQNGVAAQSGDFRRSSFCILNSAFMKGAANETCHPISQSIALPQELQTRTCQPNPSGDEVNVQLSAGGFRTETKIGNI